MKLYILTMATYLVMQYIRISDWFNYFNLATCCLFTFTASQGSDWNVVGSTTLHFTGSTTFDPKTDMFADEPIVISIVNDESAEPIEALICSLQVGVVQSVRTVDPKQVTIVINDDDGEEGGNVCYKLLYTLGAVQCIITFYIDLVRVH